MNELDIFQLGFNRNLYKKGLQQDYSFSDIEVKINTLENRLNRVLQSGDTVSTSIPGLLESPYNGI